MYAFCGVLYIALLTIDSVNSPIFKHLYGMTYSSSLQAAITVLDQVKVTKPTRIYDSAYRNQNSIAIGVKMTLTLETAKNI